MKLSRHLRRSVLARLLGADVVKFKMVGDPPLDSSAADLGPVAEPVIDLPVVTLLAGLPVAMVLPAAAPMPLAARAAEITLPDAGLTGEPLSDADLDALPETMPDLSPATVYGRGVLEPPPSDMLTVKGIMRPWPASKSNGWARSWWQRRYRHRGSMCRW